MREEEQLVQWELHYCEEQEIQELASSWSSDRALQELREEEYARARLLHKAICKYRCVPQSGGGVFYDIGSGTGKACSPHQHCAALPSHAVQCACS